MKRVAILVAVLLLVPAVLGQTTVGVKLKSEVLGEERTIFVGTPRGYEQSDQHYPVVYVTDAEAQFNHTLTTADFLAINRRMPNVIVVGIANIDRTRDFTPTAHSGRPGSERYPSAGGGAKFREFIATELIPYIEAKYRTAPYRILSGHSLGGLFAIDTLVTRPTLFNGVIAVSPSLDWDDDLVIGNARAFFANRKEFPSTLFVALGEEGDVMQHSFDSLRGILKKQRTNASSWDMRQFEGEDHGSVVLIATYYGLQKMFEDWRLPVNPRTHAVEGGWAAIKAHYRHLTEKYGFPVWVPEGIANQAGYQLLAQNRHPEAIEVLKLNVETYPKSPNVYDSLGEAYEKIGEFDLALKNYELAMRLGAEQNDPNAATFNAHYEKLAKARR